MVFRVQGLGFRVPVLSHERPQDSCAEEFAPKCYTRIQQSSGSKEVLGHRVLDPKSLNPKPKVPRP